MIKSELAERLMARYGLPNKRAVNAVLEAIRHALAQGHRVELRGFGTFSVKVRPARTGRNPRYGTTVELGERRLPYFRCGKELRERLNAEISQGEDRKVGGSAV